MQTKNAQCLNMQNAKTGRVETRLTWSAGNPGSFSPPLSANPCLFWMPKMTYELMDKAFAFSPMLSKERLLSPFSVSVSSLSSGFLHLLLPCSADFICRKWSKDRKAVLASFLFLFFFFSFFFSSTVFLPDLTATLAKERNFLSYLCFFSRLLPASL